MSSADLLVVNMLASSSGPYPPISDGFRIGVRVYLPFVLGGVFLNLGEVCDLAAGLAGFDPAGDDGIAKGSEPPIAEGSTALRGIRELQRIVAAAPAEG